MRIEAAMIACNIDEVLWVLMRGNARRRRAIVLGSVGSGLQIYAGHTRVVVCKVNLE